jgi:hypothetical protein
MRVNKHLFEPQVLRKIHTYIDPILYKQYLFLDKLDELKIPPPDFYHGVEHTLRYLLSLNPSIYRNVYEAVSIYIDIFGIDVDSISILLFVDNLKMLEYVIETLGRSITFFDYITLMNAYDIDYDKQFIDVLDQLLQLQDDYIDIEILLMLIQIYLTTEASTLYSTDIEYYVQLLDTDDPKANEVLYRILFVMNQVEITPAKQYLVVEYLLRAGLDPDTLLDSMNQHGGNVDDIDPNIVMLMRIYGFDRDDDV